MNNIIFDNNDELDDYFSNLKKLGSGYEGICYRNGNITCKIYKNFYQKIINGNFNNIEYLLNFKDVYVDNIYFIRGLILCKGKVVGSYTEYASGVSCIKKNLHRCNIDNLVNGLVVLKKNIYDLSKLGICIDDNFLGNTLYDGKVFKLIDTYSYYYFDKELDIDFIYQENMRNVFVELFQNITNKYYENDKFIYSFLRNVDSPYKDYLDDIDLIINPDKTILGIKDTISEYIGIEVDSFAKCRKKLLKKDNTV